jgi:hypothetical protein
VSIPMLPEDVDLSAASIKGFLKLVESRGLVVRVQGTASYQEPVLYLSSGEGRKIGDVRIEGKYIKCVFIVATNMTDLGITAAWYDGKFTNAFVGGQRSGNRPEKMFTQITKLTEEIKRCTA